MNLKEIVKNKIKELVKQEKEIKIELTSLHNSRDAGKYIDKNKFAELHKKLSIIKEKVKNLKKLR